MTRIIAFEGIDGTGKSVQMENLAARLTEKGKRVKTISFPIYTSFFGGEVGNLLSGRGGVRADSVDGKSMALWFALDRFEAFRTFQYKDADFLLINRYVLSNAVYQSIRDRDLGGGDLLDFVLALEYEHFGIPKADVHLVLDMNIEDAAQNVDKKGYRAYVGNEKDVYEAIPTLQARARKKYMAYAERMASIRIVPCMEDNKLKSIPSIGLLIDETLQDIIQ